MAPSSTRPSARQHELQNQVNEVQARLTEFIESTRPAHDANLRRAAALRTRTEPQEKAEQGNDRNTPNPASPDSFSPEPGSSLDRHSRKCRICNHPERDLIEADFLDWGHAERIARDFKVPYSAIYRHARAAGLIERRRQNLCPAVEKVLESVEYVEQPSAFAILRAVRTLACLTGAHWTEPPTTHVVINTTSSPVESVKPVEISSASPSSDSVVSSSELPASGIQNSNRHTYEKLELDLSDTKQTPEVSPNRHKT